MKLLSKSVNDTEYIAELFSKGLGKSDIILLNGELGAGKTAFVRGLLKGLKGDVSIVTSPSYTYLNIYEAKIKVYHMDVYLLESYDDVYELGIEDLLGNGLIVMEWGGKFAHEMHESYWQIDISYTDNIDNRVIQIKNTEDKLLPKELISYADTNSRYIK